jgi:hypothetical protein
MIPRLFLVAGLLSTLSCATAPRRGSAPPWNENSLVGVFLWDNFDFSQSRFQVLDYAKPPAIALTLQGAWALKGKEYCETVTQLSYPPWKTLIGKSQCHEVLELTPGLLHYLSRDGAPIRERQLNAAEAASLLQDPFSFVSEAERQKYGFQRY